MTTPVSNIDNTTLLNLTPNLDIGDVADPALRLAYFQYLNVYIQTITTAFNAFVANGAVGTVNLADLSVTTGKLALLAVTAAQMANGTITTTQLATGAVASINILDGTIATADLADAIISTAKLIDFCITRAKIANGVVGSSQLDPALLTNFGDIAVQAEFDKRGVNVTKYGATGDGITNDTTSIQAAIDAVIANGTKALFFPKGVYKVTSLTSLSSVSLFGNNASFSGIIDVITQVGDTPLNFMGRQAIINGNFDRAEKGTSFTNPATNTYTLDRWKVQLAGSGFPTNVVHSQQVLTSGDIPGSYYSYRVAPDGAGTSSMVVYSLAQFIENGTRFLAGNGKKNTISFLVRSSIASKRIGISLIQNYGSGGSSQEIINGTNFALTSTIQRVNFTFPMNTLAGKTIGDGDCLIFNFALAWDATQLTRYGASAAETFVGAGNIEIAQVQLNGKDIALSFQPRDAEEETRKTQRYLWVPQTNSVFARLTTYTANTLIFDVPLPVRLRTNPTVRGTVNTDIVVNTVAGVAQSGFTVAALLTSNGVRVTMTKTTHGLTDANLEIKITSGFDSEL